VLRLLLIKLGFPSPCLPILVNPCHGMYDAPRSGRATWVEWTRLTCGAGLPSRPQLPVGFTHDGWGILARRVGRCKKVSGFTRWSELFGKVTIGERARPGEVSSCGPAIKGSWSGEARPWSSRRALPASSTPCASLLALHGTSTARAKRDDSVRPRAGECPPECPDCGPPASLRILREARNRRDAHSRKSAAGRRPRAGVASDRVHEGDLPAAPVGEGGGGRWGTAKATCRVG
jgi:hypothetical protein